MFLKKPQNISTTKEAIKLRTDFERLMFELGLMNKFNRTYGLYIQNQTNYGYYAKLYLQPGLSYSKLHENIKVIEENLQCIWIMDTKKFQDHADIRIVTKPIDENIEFEKPDIKPWEMYLGLSFSLEVIKNNNNKLCMFLIAGATGSGKTRFIYMILLSWILSCGVNKVELYISDIAKDEYISLQYVKHVKYYANELDQLLKMLQYLEIQMLKRKKIIGRCREAGTATNIEEYNKINKLQMTYCYILIDEASVIMPSPGESKATKATKEQILDILGKFSKTCRSYGIFPIVATQKTVKDEIPSIIKDMATVRISFRANSGKSSESILGDDSAVGLDNRYAMYSLDGGCKKDYLFSPMLTTKRLNELLKPYIDRNYKKVDVETAIKEANQKLLPPVEAKEVKEVKQKVIKLPITKPYEDDFIKVSGDDDFADY